MNCIVDLGNTGHHREWLSLFENEETLVYTTEANRGVFPKANNFQYCKDGLTESEFIKRYHDVLCKPYINRIIFLHFDRLFNYLVRKALFGSFDPIDYKISGIWLRNNSLYQRSIKAYLKLSLIYIVLRRISDRLPQMIIYSLNEQFVDYFNGRFSRKLFQYIQDPISLDKMILNVVTNKGSLLMFGSHDKRKGTDLAIEALIKFEYPGQIVVAGPLTGLPELVENKQWLKERLDIEFYDEFVDERLMHELFSKAEIVLLPYVNFGGSSGVLGWAIAYNKIVIGTNFGLVGLRLRDYCNGYLLNSIDDLEFVIKKALNIGSRPANSEFFFNHFSENTFKKALLSD
ncbi:glycosyltransferase [Marinoscillum sp.]|uniref:glycosyltransferase n=1 Tax=Marinoscillum sp. TaxID=2024838 RepID=UPI003BABE8D2